MILDEDKLVVECTCANRCSNIIIEKFYDDFILNVFHKYSFKREKEVVELVFGKEQCQQIIDYLRRKLEEE